LGKFFMNLTKKHKNKCYVLVNFGSNKVRTK